MEVMDDYINGSSVKTSNRQLTDILTLMKVGLKETAAIKHPTDYGPVYDSKYE